jgi:protocatechuate 4,5-dioxygenase, alpha chain
VALEKPYTSIPGTIIFDLDQARTGYQLNQFCMSLMRPENRERFKANEAAYLEEWPMAPEQRQGVIARDYNRLISLGGNIFFLAKIFSTDGQSVQQAVCTMTGMTQEQYAHMMANGGRPPTAS